jgi:hypothetical protein
MLRLLLAVLIFSSVSFGQDSTVNLVFEPEDKRFDQAVEEYRKVWASEGKRIIDGLESVSGLRFKEKEVRAIVYEGASNSGPPNGPMKMRASYPADVKKATLAHELGHRMNFQLTTRPKDVDEHRILFLYLYDVWEKLYGKDFADEQVKIERGRKGLYDYDSAWTWALSMSKEERASRFRAVVRANTP